MHFTVHTEGVSRKFENDFQATKHIASVFFSGKYSISDGVSLFENTLIKDKTMKFRYYKSVTGNSIR